MKRALLLVVTGVSLSYAMQTHDTTVEIPKLTRTLSSGKLVVLPDEIFTLNRRDLISLRGQLEIDLPGVAHNDFSAAYRERVPALLYIALLSDRMHALQMSVAMRESDNQDFSVD